MVGKKQLQLIYSPVATVKRRESRNLNTSDVQMMHFSAGFMCLLAVGVNMFVFDMFLYGVFVLSRM